MRKFLKVYEKVTNTFFNNIEMNIKRTRNKRFKSTFNGIKWKTNNTKHWQKCGGTGISRLYWQQCKLVESVWKTIWKYLLNVTMYFVNEQEFHSWVYTNRKAYTCWPKDMYENVQSIIIQTVKCCTNPNIHLQKDGQ